MRFFYLTIATGLALTVFALLQVDKSIPSQLKARHAAKLTLSDCPPSPFPEGCTTDAECCSWCPQAAPGLCGMDEPKTLKFRPRPWFMLGW
jgi:hypothetical protein